MGIKLTWEDLIIEDFSNEEVSIWLSEWDSVLSGQLAPLFLSKFGDWFIRRPDDSTQMLDVIEGGLTEIAKTPEEFQNLLNDQAWQEDHLLSLLVYGFHENGIIPVKGQCYGFAPHPALVGELKKESVMLLDIPVWQSICAQTLRGTA